MELTVEQYLGLVVALLNDTGMDNIITGLSVIFGVGVAIKIFRNM